MLSVELWPLSVETGNLTNGTLTNRTEPSASSPKRIKMHSLFRSFSWLLFCSLSLAETYPTCGDCWCVPDDNGTAACPLWQPQTDFANSTIETYSAQKPVNKYILSCNPYKDSTCTTTPAQTLLDVDTAVCGYLYETDVDGTKSCSQYSMVTYANRNDLIAAGAVITHEGSCGLCSTTQDLAVYLSKRSAFVTTNRC